ncbi:hypothetical protein M0813_19538 [Anaeramoeba flamelloides]|uniref:Uncharacterized protein n=1 Tax=Anaeramoeba flamelloides TaxID=1746091 RepID=A0ABQ8YNK4_9EUKA|nr:hypothetical protein M0813_19538 [Anaeramoeba flamelloides]
MKYLLFCIIALFLFNNSFCERLNKNTLVEYKFQQGEATTCENKIGSYLDLSLSEGGCSWLMDTDQQQGLGCNGSQSNQLESGSLSDHLCDWTSQCESNFDYSGGCQHFALEFWWDKPEDDGDEEYQVWYVTNTDSTDRPIFGITYDSTLEGVGGLVVRISGRTPVGIVNKIYNWGTADLKTAGLKHIMISSEIAGGEAYYHCYLNGVETVSGVKDFTSFMMINGQPDYSDTDYRNFTFLQYPLKGKIHYSAIHDSFYDQAEAQQNYEEGLPESRPYVECSNSVQVDTGSEEYTDFKFSDGCSATCAKEQCGYDFEIKITQLPDPRTLQIFKIDTDSDTGRTPIVTDETWNGQLDAATLRAFARTELQDDNNFEIQVDPIGQTLTTYPTNSFTFDFNIQDSTNTKPTITSADDQIEMFDTDVPKNIVLTAFDADSVLETVEVTTCPSEGAIYQYPDGTTEITCTGDAIGAQYENEFWLMYKPNLLNGESVKSDQIQFVAKNDQDSETYTLNIDIKNSLTSGNDEQQLSIESVETVSLTAGNEDGSFIIVIDQVPDSSEGLVYKKGETTHQLQAESQLDDDVVEIDFHSTEKNGYFDLLYKVKNITGDKSSEQAKFTFKVINENPTVQVNVPSGEIDAQEEEVSITGISLTGTYSPDDEIMVGIYSTNGWVNIDEAKSSSYEWYIGEYQNVYAMKFTCPAPQDDTDDHCNEALNSLVFNPKKNSTEDLRVEARIVGQKDISHKTISVNAVLIPSTSPSPSPEPSESTVDESDDCPFLCSDKYTCRDKEEDCPTNIKCEEDAEPCSDGSTCPDPSVNTDDKCPPKTTCQNNQYSCENGGCALSKDDCPERPTCPSGSILCDYQIDCVDANTGKCPVLKDCSADGLIRCRDGSCATEYEDCPNFPVCPDGLVKCVTDHCVKSISDCPKFEECSESEVRCPTGVCAPSLDGCPKRIFCPQGMITCPDKTCRYFKEDCPIIPECPDNRIMCPGSKLCVLLPEQCGNEIVCPDSASIKCEDGTCTSDRSKCEKKTQCPQTRPIRCPEGTCVDQIINCPIPVKCPEGKIKCNDARCVDTSDECPNETVMECGDNEIRCPEGSCAINKEACGQMRQCMSGEIRCWTGVCLLEKDFESKCPEQPTCASDKVLCFDGVCRSSAKDCPNRYQCPEHTPFLCPNGDCQRKKDECQYMSHCGDDKFVCPDYTCVDALKDCGQMITCPESAPYWCHGRCVTSRSDCPALPKCGDLEVRCWSGECRFRGQCKPLPTKCNDEAPVLCPDLKCYASAADCEDKPRECPEGFMKCPLGYCLPEGETCNRIPTKQCDEPYSFCPADGGCYEDASECEKPDFCPEGERYCRGGCINDDEDFEKNCKGRCPFEKPLLCPGGECKRTYADCTIAPGFRDRCKFSPKEPFYCLATDSCVAKKNYCPILVDICNADKEMCADGTCRTDCTDVVKPECDDGLTYCEKYGKCLVKCPLDNGCVSEASYRCWDGECVAESTSCKPQEKNNECKDNGYQCPLGDCQTDSTQCKKRNTCPVDSPVRCGNGNCVTTRDQCPSDSSSDRCVEGEYKCMVDGSCVEDLNECIANNGCPLETPFRCPSDHECYADKSKCELKPNCPDDSPYLCASGKCTADSADCRPIIPCDEGEKRCGKYCIADDAECIERCPPETPIFCKNLFMCVSYISQCQEEKKCPVNQRFRCKNGKCVSKPKLCMDNVPDCEDGQIKCTNGECVDNAEECEAIPSCELGQLRCKDGSCADDENGCSSNNIPTCNDDETYCDDGVCRKECPEFEGCGMGLFLCPDGECAEECEKEDGKFKCWGGTYAENAVDCIKPLFRKLPFDLEYSLPIDEDSIIQIIENIDDALSDNTLLGSLQIPAGAILRNEDSNLPNVKIQIKSLANSILEKYRNNKVHDTENNERTLQKIHSVVVELLKDEEASFEDFIKVILKIYKDGLPVSEEDFCLAYYDEEEELWECIESTREEDPDNPLFYIITGKIDHFTPYAVIQSTKDVEPTPEPTPDPDDDVSGSMSLAVSLFLTLVLFFVKFI